MRRRLARWHAQVALAVTLALTAGCAQLPTSGPVHEGRTDAPAAGAIQLDAFGPGEADTPTQIVQGFIAAGAAGADESSDGDFEVARSFLTADASAAWSPLSQVLVTANDTSAEFQSRLPEAEPTESAAAGTAPPTASEPSADLDLDDLDSIVVDVQVVAIGDVDAAGVFTAAGSRAVSELSYGLVKVDGQWRIATLPDGGLMLSEVQFGLVFQAVSLQFLTPNRARFVPDVRYVPVRNAVSHAVEHLLAGPVGWLAPGVVTMIPSGTVVEPGRGVVTAESGTVEVYLSATSATTEQLDLVYAQVRETVTGLLGDRTVELWMGSVPYEPADAVGPEQAPVPRTLMAMSDGSIVTVDDSGLVPYVTEAEQGAGEAATAEGTSQDGSEPDAPGTDQSMPLNHPVPGYAEDDPVVALRGTEVVAVSPDGTTTALWAGLSPLPASRDVEGWIWTGERSGQIVALRVDGTLVEVAADFLTDASVVEIRLSRDGARAAILHGGVPGGWVELAAVVRDDDGTPIALSQGPIAVTFAVGLGLAWGDTTTLAVLASNEFSGTPSVRMVTVSGPATTIAISSQARAIASNGSLSSLYLATSDERLLARVSLRWEEVAGPVSDPAFAG